MKFTIVKTSGGVVIVERTVSWDLVYGYVRGAGDFYEGLEGNGGVGERETIRFPVW